jgi:hypothetical protein
MVQPVADLVMDAINEAFCAEIRHTYSVTSRDHSAHGGPDKAAKVLLKRIKFLQDYHNIIIDLLNNGEDENGGPG